jgi:transcription elongation regulator 1
VWRSPLLDIITLDAFSVSSDLSGFFSLGSQLFCIFCLEMNVPPLPPGWTQHTGARRMSRAHVLFAHSSAAPTGHAYYHHAATNQSSYVRPMPTFANVNVPAASAVPKKDKPLVKTPVPGTDWIRVKTVQGNIFYNNKATKASVWFIPEEIRDAVRALDEEAAAERQKQVDVEAERAKSEAEGILTKRKADTPAANSAAVKKLKTEASTDQDSDDSDEEEDWHKEAAAQLAAEAEAEEKRKQEEKERRAEEARRARQEMEEKAAQLNLPRREDLSIEEAKALFKVSGCLLVSS